MSERSTSVGLSTGGRSYLNETEAAVLLNLSKRTLQGWRLRGEGPKFQKFGRSVRYATATIKAWLEQCERTSTSASGPPDPWGIPNPNARSEFREEQQS